MPAPPDRERGAGLFSTAFGLAVLLFLLTVAVQILLNLHARSTVTTAVYDAAEMVATADGTAAQAEAHARDVLGEVGDDASFEWAVTDDVVRLHVVAQAPRVVVPLLGSEIGPDRIDRTVTVRVERPQDGEL